jgi:hypothetical protein
LGGRFAESEQLRQRETKGVRKLDEILKGRVAQCAFDSGQVRPVHIRPLCQHLLRPSPGASELTQPESQCTLDGSLVGQASS